MDIECSELTSAMFSLPYQFVVPDILFIEELSKRHGRLLKFGLQCKTMSGDLIKESIGLRQKYSRPSVNDLLALTLARHEGCQLLTGDKALREVAQVLNVEVHGTIWLVQQMIQHRKINIEIAHIAFQRMKNSGSRLPWGEVEKLLKRIKNQVSQSLVVTEF